MMNLLVVIAVFIAVLVAVGGLVFMVIGILKAIKTSNDNAGKLDMLEIKIQQLSEMIQDEKKQI